MYLRNRLPFFGRLVSKEYKPKDALTELEEEFEIVDQNQQDDIDGGSGGGLGGGGGGDLDAFEGQFGSINSKRQDVNIVFNPILTKHFCGEDLSPKQLSSIAQMKACGVSMNGSGTIWAISMERDFLFVMKPRLLQLLTVSEFVKVQKDRNRSNKDLSIFRPIGPPGFSILGDVAENTFLDYPLTSNFELPTSTVPLLIREVNAICDEINSDVLHANFSILNDLDPPLVSPPSSFEVVSASEIESSSSSSSGSGSGSGSGYLILRPVARRGYVSLGDVWFPNRGQKPTPDTIGTLVSCVHRSVLDRGVFVRFPDSENGSLFVKPSLFSLWVPRPRSENTISPLSFVSSNASKGLNHPPFNSFHAIKL